MEKRAATWAAIMRPTRPPLRRQSGRTITVKLWVGGEPEEQPYQCALSEGTYYLATDLVLEAPSNTQVGCIQIMENVTLCLNGHTITDAAGKDTIAVGSSVSFILTDCRESGKITHGTTTGGTKYHGNGVSLHQSCNFIMYGGSITGNSAARSGGGRVRVRHHDRQRQRTDHRQRQRRLERR